MLLLTSALSVNPPDGAQPGLKWVRYNTETFSRIVEEKILKTFPNNETAYSYKSIIISGSFCPNITAIYSFKLEAKPYGEFTIEDSTICNIGTVGSCTTIKQQNATNHTLYAHVCYPVNIRYRVGCPFWDRYLRISVSVNNEPYEYDYGMGLLIDTKHSDCEKGYGGSRCQNECPDCHGNGYCSEGMSGSGRCICNYWSYLPEYGCLPAPTPTPSIEFTDDYRHTRHRFAIRKIGTRMCLPFILEKLF